MATLQAVPPTRAWAHERGVYASPRPAHVGALLRPVGVGPPRVARSLPWMGVPLAGQTKE